MSKSPLPPPNQAVYVGSPRRFIEQQIGTGAPGYGDGQVMYSLPQGERDDMNNQPAYGVFPPMGKGHTFPADPSMLGQGLRRSVPEFVPVGNRAAAGASGNLGGGETMTYGVVSPRRWNAARLSTDQRRTAADVRDRVSRPSRGKTPAVPVGA